MCEPVRIYSDEIDSPALFVNAVAAVLQYWLDIHTNPEAWAYSWFGGDINSAYELWRGNRYKEHNLRGFDWERAAAYHQAKLMQNDFRVCSVCGQLVEAVNADGKSIQNLGLKRVLPQFM